MKKWIGVFVVMVMFAMPVKAQAPSEVDTLREQVQRLNNGLTILKARLYDKDMTIQQYDNIVKRMIAIIKATGSSKLKTEIETKIGVSFKK